uniref:Transposase n=1 Tax=Acrobeloides nanus TaxID=290746 RepID=A0A914CJZ9_9BILA
MKSLKNLRDAIIRAHERGKKQVEIAEFLGISTSTVNDAIKRYKESGNNEDQKGNVQCARGMIKRNPTTRANSTRKLAKKLDVSEASARRILKKDLNLKPFKFQKRQKLNAQAKL